MSHGLVTIDSIIHPERKRQDEEEASQTNPELSQKQIPNPDLEYERDAKDWWWCDDV